MNRLEFALASILDADTALRGVAPWLPDGSSRPPPLANGPGPGDDDEDDEDEDEDDDKGNIEPDDDEGYDEEDDEDDDEEPLRCVGPGRCRASPGRPCPRRRFAALQHSVI
jgi:hypothetical protein